MPCPRCELVLTAPAPFCPRCGTALAPLPPEYAVPYGYQHGYGAMPPSSSVSGIGTATVVLLAVTAVCQAAQAAFRLADVSNLGIDLLTSLPQIPLFPVFLVWFFRIRRNAGLWGPQRRAQGWSIGGWITPVVFFWFPYQIVDDAFRTSAPPDGQSRSGAPRLVLAWWLCWNLAWITGFHTTHSTMVASDGSTLRSTQFSTYLGATLVSNVFSMAAAVLCLLVVQKLTRLQEARIGAPARF